MEIQNNINQNRWQCLFYMIVALANGNFSYQIQRTGSNDELEAMVALCNMLAEELRETFRHHGYIDPRKSYRYIAKLMFILNEDLQIINFNKEAKSLLHFKESFLYNREFHEILEKESLPEWKKLRSRLAKPDFKRYTLKLDFKTNRDLSLSAFCYISRLLGQEGTPVYSVTSFQPVLLEETSVESSYLPSEEGLLPEYSRTPIFDHESDLRLVHAVRDFILKNLSETLPNIRDLAHHFGTNESKLKEEFRKIFQFTPFQFYNKERMNLAKELILNTPLPLKSIADMTGFKPILTSPTPLKRNSGTHRFSAEILLKNKMHLQQESNIVFGNLSFIIDILFFQTLSCCKTKDYDH